MTPTDPSAQAPAGLRDLQLQLTRLIVAPTGVAEALAREPALAANGLDAIVRGDDRLSARERVEIYANAYFYRLLEALKEDYPLTLAALGEDDFHNLITSYLLEFPPTEPSLFFAGLNLPDFLGTYPAAGERPWLPELAELERALLESFHASDAATLDAAALRSIPSAEWPGLSMRMAPATKVLYCRWRVDEAAGPNPAVILPNPPRLAPAAVLIWRQDGDVLFRGLEPPEAAGLALAARPQGARFDEICDAAAAEIANPADAAAAINGMLARWLADGLLAACERLP